MKLIKADKELFTFHLDRREQQILFNLIELYPLIPTAHFRLSKTGQHAEDQQLLETSLAAQRRENRKQVEDMLKNAATFTEQEDGCNLALSPGQVEWLLQILNDVRVGSWLALGSPDKAEEAMAALTEKTVPYLLAMETVGHFQMGLIEALNDGDAPAPDE